MVLEGEREWARENVVLAVIPVPQARNGRVMQVKFTVDVDNILSVQYTIPTVGVSMQREIIQLNQHNLDEDLLIALQSYAEERRAHQAAIKDMNQ